MFAWSFDHTTLSTKGLTLISQSGSCLSRKGAKLPSWRSPLTDCPSYGKLSGLLGLRVHGSLLFLTLSKWESYTGVYLLMCVGFIFSVSWKPLGIVTVGFSVYVQYSNWQTVGPYLVFDLGILALFPQGELNALILQTRGRVPQGFCKVVFDKDSFP